MTATPNRVASTLELAAELYDATTLIGVRLSSLHADSDNRKLEPPYEISTHLTPTFSVGPETITYSVSYEVTATRDDEKAFTISCTFQAGYSFTGIEISDDAGAAFGDVVVLTMLQPYLRELVHRISSDLGFPELLLDNLDSKDLLTLLRESELHTPQDRKQF